MSTVQPAAEDDIPEPDRCACSGPLQVCPVDGGAFCEECTPLMDHDHDDGEVSR